MQIGDQVGRTVIPHLNPILNTSKLKIESQIEIQWYIFPSVQQLLQIATLKHKLRWDTVLLNTSLEGALGTDIGGRGRRLVGLGDVVHLDSEWTSH